MENCEDKKMYEIGTWKPIAEKHNIVTRIRFLAWISSYRRCCLNMPHQFVSAVFTAIIENDLLL